MSDLNQVKEDSPDIARIKAVKIDLHPDYNFTEPFRGNDLAVVRLEKVLYFMLISEPTNGKLNLKLFFFCRKLM